MRNYSKHTIFAMIALVAMSLFSCTKDGDNGGSTPDTNAIAKTSVGFSIAQSADGTTNRTIDRGNIPYYVENLTIKAVSTAIPLPWTATETFDFTGVLNSTAPAITLANVALGNNTFSATSTSAAANKRLLLASATTGSLAALKAHVPYIVTTSNNVVKTITAGTNPVVALTMGTENGRVLASFGAASTEADNYKIVVSYKFGNPDSASPWLSPVAINPSDAVNRFVNFEWSNENAIDGAKVNFKIEIFEAGSTTLLKTINKQIIVQKAKSISCEFIVTNGDVHEDITSGGITITFPTIEEAPCPYDAEGYDCNGRDHDGRNRQGFNKCGWHGPTNPFYNAQQDENPGNGGANECGN